MKCPKCGCGVRKNTFCPYCKITADEIRFASNNEAKKRIKEKNTEDVYISSTIPYDVSKWKLLLITIFGGVIGLDAYYLGRHKRGIIQLAIFVVAFMLFTVQQLGGYEFLDVPLDILALTCAILVFLWIGSIFGVMLNKAKVPIVLPTKSELETRQQEYNDSIKAKEESKEEKRQKRYNKMLEKEKKNLEKKEKKSKTDEK